MPTTNKKEKPSRILSELPLLNKSQCEDVRADVYRFKQHWSSRGGSFYTLGVNCYMDLVSASNPDLSYYVPARRLNRILWEGFGWLLEEVRGLLESQLSAPVIISRDFAMPGFHLFLGTAIPTEPSASVHFDLQYEALNIEAPGPESFLSFTLPVRLPAAASGLTMWNLNWTEVQGCTTSICELKKTREEIFYRYQPGRLVLHSGHYLHQIAASARVATDDERITLQGHGILSSGTWLLYW
jgi:hypothetical protein